MSCAQGKQRFQACLGIVLQLQTMVMVTQFMQNSVELGKQRNITLGSQ